MTKKHVVYSEIIFLLQCLIVNEYIIFVYLLHCYHSN